MKKGTFTTIALLSSVLALPSYAEKVKLEQLPASLQEKIRAQTGNAQIEDIDRETRNGKTFYEVAFKRNGQHTELQIEDNSSTAATASATAALDSRKLSYGELPVPIRRIADAQVKGGEVNDVDRQVKNGQVTYEIGYKLNDGPQQELVIAQDGRVLSNTASSSVAASSPTTSPGVSAASLPNGTVSRTVAYSELPQTVRRVAEENLSHGHVSRVDRYAQGGEMVYNINFDREDGQTQLLVVSESGRILRREMNSNSAVGLPGTVQSGTASSTAGQATKYSHVTSPVQLRSAKDIELGEVPAEVRSAVRQYSNSANIEEILRGEWNGRPAYQIAFTDENKRYVEIQLDENGQVIFDPRTGTATNPQAPANSIWNNLGRALFDRK